MCLIKFVYLYMYHVYVVAWRNTSDKHCQAVPQERQLVLYNLSYFCMYGYIKIV